LKAGSDPLTTTVELSWIPLGAGQHIVKFSGLVFEAISALVQRRERCDIYHAALTIAVPAGRYSIEMTPVPDRCGSERGVVGEGAVGLKWLGYFRMFRYEIRCWLGGVIPDASAAIGTTVVSTDPACAQHLLAILPNVPTPVWGRDELNAGDMWNSNSVISWLLTQGNVDLTQLKLPDRGRAPGWSSGVVVANRANPADTVAPKSFFRLPV
jgi:hypothetical protein